jgi:large subunit ribosomal protein L30e
VVRITLAKIVKDAIASNKCRIGTRQVLQSVKGSDLIIVSKSVGDIAKSKLEERAKLSNIPMYIFDGTSIQLAKLCGKPFRISAITIKGSTDEEIGALMQIQEK